MSLSLDYDSIRLRRGLKANIVNNDGVEGEPIYTTDTKQLYVHDGSIYSVVPTAPRIITNNDEIISHNDEVIWLN